jgi:hypothetical protein
MSYDPMRSQRRRSSQLSRLASTPLGCIKLIGTVVLIAGAVFIIILLLFGHVNHV